MESPSKNRRRAASRAAQSDQRIASASRRAVGQSRLNIGPAIAVIDIGSNSVRLVVYEGLARNLTSIFNEKTLCGLGREVQTTGLLAADAVEKALTALRRFRALCRSMKVGEIVAIATAACRDASNGADFIAEAEAICRVKIDILSGAREARLAALGVVSGVHKADGFVGDLGGGSLELIDVAGHRIHKGITLPLGGLALQDISGRSIKRADALVRRQLQSAPELKDCKGRTFYAVGGTWRSLARLHISQTGYPLHVMHGYRIPAKEALAFARRVRRTNPARLAEIEAVSEARRPLLAYAALVLEHIIRVGKPKDIVISTFGVREGLLFEELPLADRKADGLIAAAQELNIVRSRSPLHGEELVAWTDSFIRSAGLAESAEDRRLRQSACLLADIGWRAHPDYRGEQALNVIANGNFGAVSHDERAFIALTVFFRYVGLIDIEQVPDIHLLIDEAMYDRARIIGTAFRVAHLISAAQPGVLPQTSFASRGRKIVLGFDRRIADLAGDRVLSRLKQLARLVGRQGAIEIV